jgi:hypothetical protein
MPRNIIGNKPRRGFGCDCIYLSLHDKGYLVLAARRFYWGQSSLPDNTEVDHFIPWSRYASDLSHKLVLADTKCKNKKRDRIPVVEHLARWTERNAQYGGEITVALRDQLPVDLGCSIRVAHWAYAQTEAAGGLTWVRREELVPLSAEWRSILRYEPGYFDLLEYRAAVRPVPR